MRRHPVSLAECGITQARYDELRAICRQYQQYKAEAAAIRRGEIDPRRRRLGAWHQSDPTGNQAVMMADNFARRRAETIEAAAKATDRVLAKYILRSVTEGLRYEYLQPPCGEKQFYRARMRFYIELDMRI